MNGFISDSGTPRSNSRFYEFGAVVAIGFSFFGGILAGLYLDFGLADWVRSFQQRTIDYSSIQWLQESTSFKLAQTQNAGSEELVGAVKSPQNIRFERRPAVFYAQAVKEPVRSGFSRLNEVIETLEANSRDRFTDFQLAANFHRGIFQNFDHKKIAQAHDWVSGSELSIQVPVPRPKIKPEHEGYSSKFSISENQKITLAPDLSPEEKSDLTNLLLGEQVSTKTRSLISQNEKKETVFRQNYVAPPKPITLAQNKQRLKTLAALSTAESLQMKQESETKSGSCGFGIEHKFEAPANDLSSVLDIQICPEKMSWLSKSWTSKGWIKLEGSRYLPTVTMHPPPGNGATLLLDEQQLGALFVRTGARITKGMGIVTGRLPPGYQIEFTGRSEETEYFESNHQKYFAILNVEPGPGVLELVSQKSQELNSTVFVPVLEDVTTFLDLSEPENHDIGVRVGKNGGQNDQEVVGLTVGLSTQNGIQAITKSDGTAILQNVRIVRGFPLFVDISSRQGQETGYAYRYQLGDPDQSGYSTVNQIAEKSLYRWLNQVKQGLSDQGAMVVGAYQRNKIDGFREEYRVAVRPLTSKFGLEPLTYTVLWNGEISQEDPLEGDLPRFMSVQVSEGLSQVNLVGQDGRVLKTDLIPVSPRVIHVISP